ncbi:MAG: helix-turn-helix domain-containing protein [Methanobrevibacter sp.]|nr:helix-turn-helix domain-containing protein [Methanobrevibacter sp.]
MPKHIISGLKYLAAVELRKNGYNQNQIAEILDMNRSTVSHYLNGRNISVNSVEVAEVIRDFCRKDFLTMVYTLLKDVNQTRTIVKICSNTSYKSNIGNSCIACGICSDACMMNAVVLDDLKAKINDEFCCGCLICGEMCPTNSITITEVK